MNGSNKKGMVVYFEHTKLLEGVTVFDSYMVLVTLLEYGRLLGEGKDAEAEKLLAEELERVSVQGSAALRYMANAARRDEERYRETVRRRKHGQSDWQQRAGD